MQVLSEPNVNWKLVVNHLKQDHPIIIPTDTNYNLCCLPSSKQGVDRIFEYKQRKKDKPLSLFFSNPTDWEKYGETPFVELMNLLMLSFWPGALNIVIKKKTKEFDYVINNSDSISLGCISNSTWRNFMSYVNGPIAITSANISGTADNLLISEDVAKEHMGDKIKFMLKSTFPIQNTKSSTIVSILEGDVKILREGDITREMLEKVVSKEGYHVTG